MAILTTAKTIRRRRPPLQAARRFVARRKLVQTASLALLIGMPLLNIFRVDIAGRHVVLFWQPVPLVWLAVILPVLIIGPLAVFFGLATRYGRLFCSWACPQGALNEAASKGNLQVFGRQGLLPSDQDQHFPRRARRRRAWWRTQGPGRGRAVVRWVARTLIMPPLAAFGFVSYVVAPAQLGQWLLGGVWQQPAVWAFAAFSGFIWIDMLLLREKTCFVCFYGYLQSVASYSARPGVQRNAERVSACHGCSGCRDSCFMGVDPRKRYWEYNTRSNDMSFDFCVSCGDCVVACDDLTSRRGVPLIMELPPSVRWPADPPVAAPEPAARAETA
jgi:polyferredoxin